VTKTYSRPRDVAKRLGISLPTLYRWVRTFPNFPRPRKIGPSVTVFDDAEIDAYVAACVDDYIATHPMRDDLVARELGGIDLLGLCSYCGTRD
jgi:prophage regulatory protein